MKFSASSAACFRAPVLLVSFCRNASGFMGAQFMARPRLKTLPNLSFPLRFYRKNMNNRTSLILKQHKQKQLQKKINENKIAISKSN